MYNRDHATTKDDFNLALLPGLTRDKGVSNRKLAGNELFQLHTLSIGSQALTQHSTPLSRRLGEGQGTQYLWFKGQTKQ